MVTETVAREHAIVSQGSLGLIAHEVCSLTHVHTHTHTRSHTTLQRNKQPMSLFIIGFRLSFEQVRPARGLLVGLNSQAWMASYYLEEATISFISIFGGGVFLFFHSFFLIFCLLSLSLAGFTLQTCAKIAQYFINVNIKPIANWRRFH